MLLLRELRTTMKKQDFLNKLKKEETLKIIEPSDEISKSYVLYDIGYEST